MKVKYYINEDNGKNRGKHLDIVDSAKIPELLTKSQIEDLRLAASKMKGVERRSFQASIALKYCQGRARLAETVFGWGRQSIELGLAETTTGISCKGLQSTNSGAKRWEEKEPIVALSLQQIAESHCQQDPTFKTSLAYTRLTAASALEQLKEQGFKEEQLPCASTMAQVLNRMGYRLRKVLKAKPQKKLQKQTISSTI